MNDVDEINIDWLYSPNIHTVMYNNKHRIICTMWCRYVNKSFQAIC